MTDLTSDWPNDADGDVFRRLRTSGFDFSNPYSVDYNVDFNTWPPAKAAIDQLESMFGRVKIYEPDEHGAGYVQFQIIAPVTYEAVTTVQRKVSAAMQPFGGVCESWGVIEPAP
jgi:hypothetical protein